MIWVSNSGGGHTQHRPAGLQGREAAIVADHQVPQHEPSDDALRP